MICVTNYSPVQFRSSAKAREKMARRTIGKRAHRMKKHIENSGATRGNKSRKESLANEGIPCDACRLWYHREFNKVITREHGIYEEH